MSAIKPSDHGIVVDHKESGVRFAVSDANHDPKSERKVRDLRPGESVLSYVPKATPSAADDDEGDETDAARKEREAEAVRLAENARQEEIAQASRDAEAAAAKAATTKTTDAPTPGAAGK